MKELEKIFLYPYSTDGIYEVETKPLEGTVEYTRTDTFIERACEWLKNSTYGYLTEKWGETELDRETLAADFAKYMKGE
jgi:hypothetical protein